MKDITKENQSSQIVIVTGYSGAGKSSVLRTLEDIGYVCVDNLPISLLPQFFEASAQPSSAHMRIALGIDIRSSDRLEQVVEALQHIKKEKSWIRMLFLRASSTVLMKRFQETRRKHPLAHAIHLADAIEKEQILMRPLIDHVDMIFDTDQTTIHQLRAIIRASFTSEEAQMIVVSAMSFGFKYGVPTESNYVFDLRSLPNPYFIESLRAHTGMQEEISSYLFAQPEVQEYWTRLLDFISFAISKSYQEGRSFIHIAIGCTGGKHRSVAFIEKLAIQQIPNACFLVQHRDMGRE